MIIFVVISLLTGKVLFDVQGVQAERAAGLPTVFQTNSVNPQAITTNPTTATTTGVHMPFGYGTANTANTANTNHKGVSSTTTTTNSHQANQANQANTANTNHKGVSLTTIAHNTASVFGAFFQTAGKTTSTAKTNNANPASTSTIADPVTHPPITLVTVAAVLVVVDALASESIPQFIDLFQDAKNAAVSGCEQEPNQQLCQAIIGHLSSIG